MKKTLILLAALALTTAGTSFAQTTPAATSMVKARKQAPKSPTQKADRHAGKMAKELGLNADQEAKVEQLLLARQQESAALKTKHGTNKKAGRPEMKAAHDRYEAQMKTILTSEQFTKMRQMKADHHNHGKMKDGGKMKMKR